MRKRHRALAVAALLVVTLSGCSYVRTAELPAFAGVDAIAAELDLQSLGSVTSMEYSGGTSYGEPAPTLRMVVAGDDVVVNAEASLADAGWEASPVQDTVFHYWERADDRVFVELLTNVEPVAAEGDEADDRPGERVARDDLFALTITAYPE